MEVTTSSSRGARAVGAGLEGPTMPADQRAVPHSFPSAAIFMKAGSKRSFTLPVSPSVFPPGNSMPTKSGLGALRRECRGRRGTADKVHGVDQRGALAKATASAGVVEHLRRGELRVEAGEVGAGGRPPWPSARRAASPVSFAISPIASYQAATSALPKFGVVRERLGVDHHDVDDLAGDLRGVEDLLGVRGRRRSRRGAGSRSRSR